MTSWLSLLICHCEERSNLNCLHTNPPRGPKTASLFRFARNNRDFTLPRTWYSTILDCFTKEVRNDSIVGRIAYFNPAHYVSEAPIPDLAYIRMITDAWSEKF